MFVVKRSIHNPIVVPYHDHPFEAAAVFNMCPIKKGRKTIGLYRAMSHPDPLRDPKQISIVAKAESDDGLSFENRVPFIEPNESWEEYGCEDPRVTFFEDKYYIFYTALGGYPFGPDNIKAAVAISKDLKKVDERHLVTPFNAKAMTLFPERIGGKICFLLTVDPDSNHSRIAVGYADKIEDLWSEEFWKKWKTDTDIYCLHLKRKDWDHIEIGAPPVKTKDGWLLVYSHIQYYFPNPDGASAAFGTQAVLLDLQNPHTILTRTKGSFLSPEELYERRGAVSEIVFPSGATVEKDVLHIYYGGADNVICRASVRLSDILETMRSKNGKDLFIRAPFNPILTPVEDHPWESQAVFNPGALRVGGKTYLFYRAMSGDNTSVVGLAVSSDNQTIEERLPEPIYVPRQDFEMKHKENGNSGCEDPRVMLIEGRIYMCYTAYDGVKAPRVAVSSIALEDFLERRFSAWSSPTLLTPEGVDDKDSCIFDQKIGGKYLVLHRVGTDICGDYIDTLDFNKERVTRCISVLGPRTGMWDSAKVGISSPPIKTEYGWVLLYHGVSKLHSTYRIGAALLDKDDPTIVLARSTDPVFQPAEDYELEGIVKNVVFPCGSVVVDGVIYIYYGGADKVVGVAHCKLEDIVEPLVKGASLS